MPSLKTWIDPEDRAYPRGGFSRTGRARVRINPYRPELLAQIAGHVRAVRASVADSFFTIPARLRYQGKTIKGYLSMDTSDGEIDFTPERYQTMEEEQLATERGER
jgi:hypothetical protein